MSFLSAKKLLLFGLVLMLLVGIPVGVYLVQQEQETRSRAEKSTVTSFEPESTASSPITAGVGEEFTVDMIVNPGINLVSFIRFEITYDPEIIALVETNPFSPNQTAFPVTMDGPVLGEGKIAGTLSVGADPTKAIQTTTRVATITFRALKATGEQPTTVVYRTPQTQVLSIGDTDQASEDVLSTTAPAYIVISDGTTPSPSPSVSPSVSPSASPTPTSIPSPTPVTGGPTNQLPLCTSLISSNGNSGMAPFTTTFTAAGEDPDGVISKVTFNFGDSQVEDITDPSVVEIATVSATATHTYETAGSYQVSALMTDDVGAVSDQTNCTQTITVNDITPTASAAPTLEPTGPGSTFLGIGAVLSVLTIIGGLLFFTL